MRNGPRSIGAEAVHRGVVDLVVPGVDDPPARRLEDNGHGVRNRVRHPHELGRVRADLRRPVLRHGLDELRISQEPVLVELRLDEPQREPGRPDLRNAHLPQEVREGADVVLVPVGEDDRADVALVILEVGEVRKDEIDAQMLVARERQAGVDDDDPVVALDDHHVLSDLAQPPKRDQSRALGSHRASVLAPG
jgi:hypothetical protein